MKKFILSFIISLFISAVATINAQSVSLEIKKTDNTEQKIALSSLKKLTFSGSDMIVNYSAGSNENIAISDIRKMIFGTISGLSTPLNDENRISLYPNPAVNFISFKNFKSENSKVCIYSTSGILVFTTILQSETLDISNLNKGIYILKIDNQALKFSKL